MYTILTYMYFNFHVYNFLIKTFILCFQKEVKFLTSNKYGKLFRFTTLIKIIYVNKIYKFIMKVLTIE